MSAKTLTEAFGKGGAEQIEAMQNLSSNEAGEQLSKYLSDRSYERYIEEESLVYQLKNLTAEWPRTAAPSSRVEFELDRVRYEHLCKTDTTLEQYATMLKIGAYRDAFSMPVQMSNEEWARLTLLGY